MTDGASAVALRAHAPPPTKHVARLRPQQPRRRSPSSRRAPDCRSLIWRWRSDVWRHALRSILSSGVVVCLLCTDRTEQIVQFDTVLHLLPSSARLRSLAVR